MTYWSSFSQKSLHIPPILMRACYIWWIGRSIVSLPLYYLLSLWKSCMMIVFLLFHFVVTFLGQLLRRRWGLSVWQLRSKARSWEEFCDKCVRLLFQFSLFRNAEDIQWNPIKIALEKIIYHAIAQMSLSLSHIYII